MPKFDAEGLGQRIEQVIQEHLSTAERVAAEAIARAFGTRRSGSGPRLSPRVRVQAVAGRRRSASELSGLREQLYQAVSAKPGETMRVLAQGLGQTPRALHRPMDHLRGQGRIRSVGQRHLTRYYPLSSKE